jgi:hypothetical protein
MSNIGGEPAPINVAPIVVTFVHSYYQLFLNRMYYALEAFASRHFELLSVIA